ncbi:type II toxin-antitoxin system RelE/ParE family toxin [Brevundimonas staleyi]|uniref:Type II toxin-antitoxin system RelE/ParE family toxin n=1 Tax=Brevundimonas staleyi TaxID=74326 RepID=A0ABW0FRB6_9CAUL
MKVVLTDAALADLEGAGDYIAADSPRRARTFVAELVAKAREIGRGPSRFPLVARYEQSGVRRRVHGAYLIFYRIDADAVVILHVLHGAYDYEPLLFPEA